MLRRFLFFYFGEEICCRYWKKGEQSFILIACLRGEEGVHMRIGVLYAMPKEAKGLLAACAAAEPETIAGMPVYLLRGGAVACIGGVGKVNTAMAVQMLLDRYDVDCVVNVGCAGALADLPAGTLVLGTDCVQHDVDTTLAGDPPGLVSTVNCVRFPCSEQLETVTLLANMGYPFTPGTIATGDWFGRDYDRARMIRETYGALVCDMEACAAAQVCLRNGIAFQAFKVVTDHLFAAHQENEYQENFDEAMALLNDAVAVYLDLMED